MDEQDVKVIPETKTEEYSPPPHTSSEGSDNGKPGKVARQVIRHALPLLLMGISVTFFASTAVAIATTLGIDGTDVTRMMLGEFVGGKQNVVLIGSDGGIPGGFSDSAENQPTDTPLPLGSSIPDPAPPVDYSIPLNNETPYRPNMSEIINFPRAIPTLSELYATYGKDAPVVLVIHTHGCEGYESSAASEYRTSDKEKSVVAVGRIITAALNSAGINTIHTEELFDQKDFNMAYYNASLEIRKVIAQYPSISYVIDVHRDSVTLADGTPIPMQCTVNGASAAQLMLVIGTDHGGSGHAGWQDNLALAARLQYAVDSQHAGVMRNINLRSASFNEQYTKGSLLLEVGSSANTLEEAKTSAKAFADALIREIIGY